MEEKKEKEEEKDEDERNGREDDLEDGGAIGELLIIDGVPISAELLNDHDRHLPSQ